MARPFGSIAYSRYLQVFSRCAAALLLIGTATLAGADGGPSLPDAQRGPRANLASSPRQAVRGGAVRNVSSNLTYPSIQAAISAASSGDELLVEAPTLDEGLVTVDRSVTLRGASGTEVVRATTDTGDSGDARAWFLVQPGTVLNVSDLRFEGTGRQIWQAFRLRGSGSFDHVEFQAIRFGPYQGTAIAAFGDGPVSVDAGHFSQIGRIGVFLFGSGVSGSTVTASEFVGKGDGDFLDYGIEVSSGASATVSGNVFRDARGEASTDGTDSAGVFLTTAFGPGTDVSLSANQFLRNSWGVLGGSGGGDSTSYSADFNRFAGNGVAVQHDSTSAVDLTLNWWGCNEGPGSADCDAITPRAGSGAVASEPWLVFSVGLGTPEEIPLGGSAGAVAALTTDSGGNDVSGLGKVADAIPVAFAAAPLGTVSAVRPTLAGRATAAVEGIVVGTGQVNATLDSETVTTPLVVVDGVPLYDSIQHHVGGAFSIISQDTDFTPPGQVELLTYGADDFTIAGARWSILQVAVKGNYFSGDVEAATANVYVLGDGGAGFPDSADVASAALQSLEGLPIINNVPAAGDVVIPLDAPLLLDPGTYWLAVQVNLDIFADTPLAQWGWTTVSVPAGSGEAAGSPGVWLTTLDTFGGDSSNCVGVWGKARDTCGFSGRGDPDFAFVLRGQVIPIADISVVKDDGVTTAVAGGSVTYTVTVANAGPSTDPGVLLTDLLPPELTCTYTSQASGGASGNTVAGAGSLSEMLSMPAGSAVDYTLICDIDSSAKGLLTNTAAATASVTELAPGNNSSTDADTLLIAETDLTILKSDDGLPGVAPGDSIGYQLTVSNNGPSDSTGATITDVLPPGLSFLSSADCSAVGGTVTCAVGALTSGGSRTVSFQVGVASTQTGPLINTASVSANETDSNSANDASTETTDLVPVFSKAFADVGIELGGRSTLTFTIDNFGSTTAAVGLAFTDDLPMEIEVAAAPTVVNGCGGTVAAVAGSSVITLVDGLLAAGASCSLSVDVAAVALGTAQNVTSPLTSSLGTSAAAAADLGVGPRATSTAVVDEAVTFSDVDQALNLQATVSAAAPVDQGTVTFSVFDGPTLIGMPVTSGTVTAGMAAAVFTVPGGTPAASYTIEASYSGSSDFSSSDGVGSLVVEESLPGDKDGDGVDSMTEDGAPNGGDGNGDGIADRFQSTVTSLPSATTGDYVTVVSSGAGCRNELVQTFDPTVFPTDATVATSYALLQGLVGFELTCGAAQVTLIFHGESDLSSAEYRKYGPTPEDPVAHWYSLDASFGTTVVGGASVALTVIDLVDGGLGDHDLAVDGRIVDPGGVAMRGIGIPTADSWALVLLAIGLSGAALAALRWLR